jgi:hypothetical protein
MLQLERISLRNIPYFPSQPCALEGAMTTADVPCEAESPPTARPRLFTALFSHPLPRFGDPQVHACPSPHRRLLNPFQSIKYRQTVIMAHSVVCRALAAYVRQRIYSRDLYNLSRRKLQQLIW